MKRAEERALEVYPMKDYNKEPNYIHSCDSKMLDEVYREVFMLGYHQAEKDTLERAIAWLKSNAVNYIYNYTDSYPDAPFRAAIGGKCWEDLKEYMDKEDKK